MKKCVAIIGGGAGGMTTAAQLKKQDPEIKVVVFEKSPYVSWAGCPTPYYIAEELSFKSVVHFSPDFFKERGIEIYTEHEVEKIDFENNKLLIKGKEINGSFDYDELVLSLGGKTFTPEIKGMNRESSNLFKLSHASDAVKIKNYIDEEKPKKAVIIGSGFIGLEMSESFTLRGIETTIIEMQDKIFPNISERARKAIYNKMEEKKINLILNQKVTEVINSEKRIKSVILENGETIDADIILLAIGIKPNIDLLEKSGFKFNDNNKVYVNDQLKTSMENVYALGDLIYNDHQITGGKFYAPFGDVADKQGIILSKILAGKKSSWKGVIGTSAFSFFDLKIARTGLTLEQAIAKGYPAKSTKVNGLTKVSGFKDSKAGDMEIIYDSEENIILGASMFGYEAIAQFIDQIAIAITFKINISDFFDIDFAYSPTNSTVWNPMLAAYRRIIK